MPNQPNQEVSAQLAELAAARAERRKPICLQCHDELRLKGVSLITYYWLYVWDGDFFVGVPSLVFGTILPPEEGLVCSRCDHSSDAFDDPTFLQDERVYILERTRDGATC